MSHDEIKPYQLPEDTAADLHLAIVCTRWHDDIIQHMRDACISHLLHNGIKSDHIMESTVPGAFELPLAVQTIAQSGNYHAVIAFAAIIKGETAHYNYIAQACHWGLTQATLNTKCPILSGILVTNNLAQARERADVNRLNKGAQVANSALEMINFICQHHTD